MFAHTFTGQFDAIGIVNEAVEDGVCDGGITNDFMMPVSSIVYCVGRERAECRSARPSVLSAMVVQPKLSRSSPVAEAMDYMLKRWSGFTTFLDDARICLTNNAAERVLRGFALGRKSWLFAGSDRSADRAAHMATLIMSAKLNDIDPQAWLADVLANIADTPISRLEQLLPWNWMTKALNAQAA